MTDSRIWRISPMPVTPQKTLGKSDGQNVNLTQDDVLYVLARQERDELTANDHAGALRLIETGLLATDGWRYMSVEEARECWRVCHK